tara:strand:- start:225 stop:467 length:243 start_codon:yes stop_codon:yes gene_type:complete
MTTEVALLSVNEIGEELNNVALRNSCMKSTDPMARLRYLEVLLKYHEVVAVESIENSINAIWHTYDHKSPEISRGNKEGY